MKEKIELFWGAYLLHFLSVSQQYEHTNPLTEYAIAKALLVGPGQTRITLKDIERAFHMALNRPGIALYGLLPAGRDGTAAQTAQASNR